METELWKDGEKMVKYIALDGLVIDPGNIVGEYIELNGNAFRSRG